MPILELPSGDTDIAGGDLPVSSSRDVLAEFPRTHRRSENAPVRDAFASAYAEGFKKYQNIASYAAAQSDPTRATGDSLQSFAEERSVVPEANEKEQSVRDRLFDAPDIVTPLAIVAGVNKLLAPYTTKKCRVAEPELDGLFINDGTAEWDSFIGADPNYPDRYYEDREWLSPGGAVPSTGLVRTFLLRIPDMSENDTEVSYVLDDEDGVFIGDGSDTGGSESDGSVALSLFASPRREEEIYAAIAGYVESVKGQGFSWSIVVDPTL